MVFPRVGAGLLQFRVLGKVFPRAGTAGKGQRMAIVARTPDPKEGELSQSYDQVFEVWFESNPDDRFRLKRLTPYAAALDVYKDFVYSHTVGDLRDVKEPTPILVSYAEGPRMHETYKYSFIVKMSLGWESQSCQAVQAEGNS